jgi:hypothetical protein
VHLDAVSPYSRQRIRAGSIPGTGPRVQADIEGSKGSVELFQGAGANDGCGHGGLSQLAGWNPKD